MGELADLITEEELDYWREFSALFPFDDLHRHHRPAALLISSNAAKGQGEAAFKGALETLSPKPKKKQRPLRTAREIPAPKENP